MNLFVGVHNLFSCYILKGFSDDCVGVIAIFKKHLFCAFTGCNWEGSSLFCVHIH